MSFRIDVMSNGVCNNKCVAKRNQQGEVTMFVFTLFFGE